MRRISRAAPAAFFGRTVRAYLLKSQFAHILQTGSPLPPSLHPHLWGIFSGMFVFQSKSPFFAVRMEIVTLEFSFKHQALNKPGGGQKRFNSSHACIIIFLKIQLEITFLININIANKDNRKTVQVMIN